MRAVAVAVVLLMFGGCSSGNGSGQQVEVVAGGGEGGRIRGFVSDIDVQDGRLVMVGEVAEKMPTMWRVDPSGTIVGLPLPAMSFPTGVEIAPDGTAFLLDGSGIWRVQGERVELYVGDSQAQRAAPVTETGFIDAVAVDDDGRLLWTAFDVDERRGSDRLLIVVRRLEDGKVTTIAGTERSPSTMPGALIYDRQENPPPGSSAVGFPLASPGPAYDLTADSTGVYLLGAGYVLRVAPDGVLSKVLGGEGRNVPERPFADEAPAVEHGFGVSETENGVSVASGRLVVVDDSLRSLVDEGGEFTWTGDFTESQQMLVDRVMSTGKDFDRREPFYYGGVALLTSDGAATTAAAHVHSVALDGDWLYLVGQAGRFEDPGPEEAILIRVSVENWP